MAKQISKQASAKVSAVPVLLQLLQSKLWYNDRYKLYFSQHHTNNPNEYYCFFLDSNVDERRHAKYRMTTDGIFIKFLKNEYYVKELERMRRYDITMMQLTNTSNELDYMNWLGVEIPIEKGSPYRITDISRKREL